MKKRVPKYLLVIAILLLSISLWKNYSYSVEKEQIKVDMLSSSFYTLQSLSAKLNELLVGIEEDGFTYEECENRLIQISRKFTELHFSLKTFATYFPPSGITRNSYSGHISFEFIGYTLVDGWTEINGTRYNGIMYDNTVSDKEIQYLMSLKESVDKMIVALASEEDPHQIREISPSYLDEVISEFTDKYYTGFGNSTLKLLLNNT